jgi:hypothetical protein
MTARYYAQLFLTCLFALTASREARAQCYQFSSGNAASLTLGITNLPAPTIGVDPYGDATFDYTLTGLSGNSVTATVGGVTASANTFPGLSGATPGIFTIHIVSGPAETLFLLQVRGTDGTNGDGFVAEVQLAVTDETMPTNPAPSGLLPSGLPTVLPPISAWGVQEGATPVIEVQIFQIGTPPPPPLVFFGNIDAIGSPCAPTCASLINGRIAQPILGGNFFPFSLPINILGSFTPAPGYTLDQAAAICGFKKFDWQQTIIHMPDPSPACQINADPTKPNPSPFCGIQANNSPPFPIHLTGTFFDPPPNGYSNISWYNSYPFYYPQATLETTCAQYSGQSGPCVTPVVNTAGTTLSFFDQPTDPCLGNPVALTLAKCGYGLAAAGAFIEFQTHLAGVKFDGTAFDLGIGYRWNTTYNGLIGGIANDGSSGTGSGTGGIAVLNVSNTTLYQYPRATTSPAPMLTLLTTADVEVTASGLSYSRVSQTFVGFVTILNTSGGTISGPFQIVFNSLPSSVSLVNATGSFAGSPYLTIPGADSLVPGQLGSVTVQFKNPSNAQINLVPVVYAGSFN